MTLKASTEQIRAWNQRRPPPVPPEVAAATRAAKVRLHMQGNPREFRGQPVPVREFSGMEVSPTPERVARGGVAVHTLAEQGQRPRPVYRSKSAVEHYSEDWPSDIYNAFLAYIRDARASDGPPITIDYDRNGGSSLGKLGGLGNVHQAVRDMAERFQWVRPQITEGSVAILDWLVIEVNNEVRNRAMSMSEVGQRFFPRIRDKSTTKGIALGRLHGAGEELARAYRKHAVLSRGSK